LGAIANPLLPMLRERELLFMLRQSGARLLFVPERYRGTNYLELGDRVRQLGAPVEAILSVRSAANDAFAAMIRVVGRPPASRAQPDDLLLLMYTSGTTADPKGVLHSNATLVAEVQSLERAHRLGPADSTLMPSPLTHISGVVHGIMSPAILATTAVLMDRWEPDRATELIAGERITYMVGAPIFLQDLLAASGDRDWAHSLRLYSCGGASVSADLMRRAGEQLGCVAKRVYGSTEFPTITTTGPDDASGAGIETEGKPIAPNEVRIVDPHGNVVATGEQGEIQARGPECFVGYADACLNDDSFSEDGWFRTGDLGRIDRDGYLTVTGRIKEIVIRKGEKISIREVEGLLLSHPAIERASVVGISDPDVGERLCAALELAMGVELSAAEVVEFLRAQGLATRKLPERIEFVRPLPRTDSGKVHRSAVVALFEKAREGERD
jgi:cyclohexanecarboxylate-CoA ligase